MNIPLSRKWHLPWYQHWNHSTIHICYILSLKNLNIWPFLSSVLYTFSSYFACLFVYYQSERFSYISITFVALLTGFERYLDIISFMTQFIINSIFIKKTSSQKKNHGLTFRCSILSCPFRCSGYTSNKCLHTTFLRDSSTPDWNTANLNWSLCMRHPTLFWNILNWTSDIGEIELWAGEDRSSFFIPSKKL